MDKDKTTPAEQGNGNVPKNAKENLYDKIPLTRKQLDVIIIVLIVAFVVFLALGTLIGNGIIDGPKLF